MSFILNVIMLDAIMLNVVMQSVIKLSVLTPGKSLIILKPVFLIVCILIAVDI
jgi:hypothetical protein